MTAVTGRWLRSRCALRFRRSRAALLASAVIGLYAAAALAILLFGLVSVEETQERVGPSQVPGLGLRATPEKRLESAGFWLEAVEAALRRADPAAALADVRFAEVRVARRTPEELRAAAAGADRLRRDLAAAGELDGRPERLERLAELERAVAALFDPPRGLDGLVYRLRTSLGTDRQGRSIAVRAFYSIAVAVQIGLVTALAAALFGSLLGAAAGFFGGWLDGAVVWLYSTFSAVPHVVLLVLLAYVFSGAALGGTLVPIYAAFSLTFWIAPCRVVRGETLKLRELEYVQAATAAGFGRLRVLLRHVLPNTAHLVLVNSSLLFIGAVKSEVILSFLGLGLRHGSSWGIMISQSRQEVLNGFFWQIGAATAGMFGLVLACSVFTDALQDALDPRHAT